MSVTDKILMAGNYLIPEGCKHQVTKAILVLKTQKCSKIWHTHTFQRKKKKYNFLLASHPRTTIADFFKFYIIYYLFGFQDFKKFIYRYKIIFLIFLYILKKNSNSFFLSPPSHQHTCSFIRGSQSPNTISAQMLR